MAMRSGFLHELSLRRGQAVGLIDEVAEGTLPFQGFGGAGASDGACVFVPQRVKPLRSAFFLPRTAGLFDLVFHPQPVEPCALGLRLTGLGDLTIGSHALTLGRVTRRVASNECSKRIFAH
jgi:hypothetical protein